MDITKATIQLVVSGLAILIPAALIYYYKNKHKLSYTIAIYGAGLFFMVQTVHVPLVVFTQKPLFDFVSSSFSETGAILFIAFYLAILAALFEEPARYLLFKKYNKYTGLSNAKLFGLGWGGMESILFLGILASANFFVATAFFESTDLDSYSKILIEQGYTEEKAAETVELMEAQKQLMENTSPFLPIVALFERAVAMTFHFCASILVMLSVLNGNRKWFYAAFLGHFVLDFIVVLLAYFGLDIFFLEAATAMMVLGFVYYTGRELGGKEKLLK